MRGVSGGTLASAIAFAAARTRFTVAFRWATPRRRAYDCMVLQGGSAVAGP